MAQTASTQLSARGDGPRLAPHPVLGRFYTAPDQRQAVVNRMFDDSARHYDRIITLMSFGTGSRYRRQVLRGVGIGPGSHVLDVACGTGPVSAAALSLVGETGRVLGVDPSEGMRSVAERRRGIRTLAGTAERLPVDDGTFDFVVMGYALRHVADLISAFGEMRRVLRPGGKVVILEITPPRGRAARAVLKGYLKYVVPPLSLAATGSRGAMRLMEYYWQSIEECVSPGAILEAMAQAGLQKPVRSQTLGIFNEYIAAAPGGGAVKAAEAPRPS